MPGKKIICGMLAAAFLLLSGRVNAQADADVLSFREEVLLTSERQLLLPGESCLVHVIVREKGRPVISSLSGYVNLDLTSPDGITHGAYRVRLNRGEALVRLTLPSDMKTGWFRLRAYTNWMRNFSADHYARQLIRVVQPHDDQLFRYISEADPSLPVQPDLIARTRDSLPLDTGVPATGEPVWIQVSRMEPGSLQTGQDHVQKETAPQAVVPSTGWMHLPEISGEVIEGRLADSDTGQGAPGTELSVNLLNQPDYQQTATRQDGRFYFVLHKNTRQTDYLVSPVYEPLKPKEEITVWSSFDPETTWDSPVFTLTPAETEFLRTRSQYDHLLALYKDTLPSTIPESDPKPAQAFFHPPDRTIILDDYIRLAHIREVIYEVVQGVSVRSGKEGEKIRIYAEQPFAGAHETLVLLDGIPLLDQESVLQLPPDRIDRIEVKNQLYVHGTRIYSSILHFVSPNSDYAGMELPAGSRLIRRTAAEEPDSWVTPLNLTRPHIPELGNTLLWMPLNKESRSLYLKTNDQRGLYLIRIYSLDESGIRIHNQLVLLVQ